MRPSGKACLNLIDGDLDDRAGDRRSQLGRGFGELAELQARAKQIAERSSPEFPDFFRGRAHVESFNDINARAGGAIGQIGVVGTDHGSSLRGRILPGRFTGDPDAFECRDAHVFVEREEQRFAVRKALIKVPLGKPGGFADRLHRRAAIAARSVHPQGGVQTGAGGASAVDPQRWIHDIVWLLKVLNSCKGLDTAIVDIQHDNTPCQTAASTRRPQKVLTAIIARFHRPL